VDSIDALSPEATCTPLRERDRFLAFLQDRVGTHEVAEEILQDAYAKAIERGGQLRDDESVVAWFFRILRNAIVERARREAATARALQKLGQEMATGPNPKRSTEPSAAALRACSRR
jgi:RNA polymerase sigma-70 factor (ECF subfamily)